MLTSALDDGRLCGEAAAITKIAFLAEMKKATRFLDIRPGNI
jgi:hypothetical protein